MHRIGRAGLVGFVIATATGPIADEVRAQEASGAVIEAITAIDGGGNAQPGCGLNGNTLTTALNTVLGTPGFDDEGVGIASRRAAFRICDFLSPTGANGWTGSAAATADQVTAGAIALAPEEFFANLDNARSAFDTQTGNIARRIQMVRMVRRRQSEEAIAIAQSNRMGVRSATTHASDAIAERGPALMSRGERAERALLALQEGINAGDEVGSGLGFFLNGRVHAIKGDENEAERGSDGVGGGFTLGVDTALDDALFAGLAFGYTHVDTYFDGTGSESTIDAVTLSGYGAFYPSDELIIDGSLSVSWLGFENQNELLTLDGGPPIGDLDADANGTNVGFDVGVGYMLDVAELAGNEEVKGLIFEPFARLNVLYTFIEEHDQTSGDASIAITIDEQDTTSVTATVGFRTEYPFSTRFGVVTPYVRAAYVHEFNDENSDIGASFAYLPGSNFKLKASATDSHYGNFGAGLAATLGQGLSQFIDYDVVAGHDNVTVHQVTAGLRLEF